MTAGFTSNRSSRNKRTAGTGTDTAGAAGIADTAGAADTADAAGIAGVTDTAGITASIPDTTGSTGAQRRHLRLVHSGPGQSAPQAAGTADGTADEQADRGLFTNDETASDSGRRARDHAPLSPLGKGLRREILISGMSSGATVDPDALSAILSAKSVHHRVPLTLFTEDIVWQLLWVDVHQWCGRRRVPVPDSVPHTLWNLLSHLHDTQQLAPGSDPIDLLHGPIISNCAFDELGRSRHPTGRRNA